MIEIAEIFPWSDQFETGIAEIDAQHRRLVQLLNLLASHLVHQSDPPTLISVFTELADYAVYHFQTEEAIWHHYFPGDEAEARHKQVHDSFIYSVLALKFEEHTKPMEKVLEDTLSFLTHWLAFHILDSDKHLARVVLAMQSGMSLERAKLQAERDMAGAVKVLVETILSMYDSLSTRTLQLMKEVLERQRAEEKLRLAGNIFENTLDAILITDAEHHVIDANPALYQSCGHMDTPLIGKRLEDVKSGFSQPEFASRTWSAVAEHGHWSGEITSRVPSGELETKWMTLSAIKDEQARITHYVAVFSNVTQLIQNQHTLKRLAHYDPLTGLPNRTLLADRLELAMAHAERTRAHLAICFVDLDGFKQVNDRLGHDAGDTLLREIALRLKTCVRQSDTVARLGGDEFVLVLGEMKQPSDCKNLLDKLLAEVSQPVPIGDDQAHVSASIGVSVFPADGSTGEALMTLADRAMYQAKRDGKSRYHFHEID